MIQTDLGFSCFRAEDAISCYGSHVGTMPGPGHRYRAISKDCSETRKHKTEIISFL